MTVKRFCDQCGEETTGGSRSELTLSLGNMVLRCTPFGRTGDPYANDWCERCVLEAARKGEPVEPLEVTEEDDDENL